METEQQELSFQARERIELMLRSAQARRCKYARDNKLHPPSIYYMNEIKKAEKEIEDLKKQLE